MWRKQEGSRRESPGFFPEPAHSRRCSLGPEEAARPGSEPGCPAAHLQAPLDLPHRAPDFSVVNQGSFQHHGTTRDNVNKASGTQTAAHKSGPWAPLPNPHALAKPLTLDVRDAGRVVFLVWWGRSDNPALSTALWVLNVNRWAPPAQLGEADHLAE